MKSKLVRTFTFPAYPTVKAGIVDWPASVIRLSCEDRDALHAAASHILRTWKTFDDPDCQIYAFTGDTPHNTLNPIVHKEGDDYIIDLVLRNNRTTEDHPWGLFHPDEPLHHIKKENIGLIEIMGLAILPGRLIRELPAVQAILYESAVRGVSLGETMEALEANDDTVKHAVWAVDVLERRREELAQEESHHFVTPGTNPLGAIMRDEVGSVFAQILECTGMFKHDETGRAGWDHFLTALGVTDVSDWA